MRGDTYKLCYAPPGQERPKEFSAREGTGYTLSTWQRKPAGRRRRIDEARERGLVHRLFQQERVMALVGRHLHV